MDLITGSGHGGKHPALSVFDWLGSVAQVVLENFVASSPHPRANTIFERALPFAFQQSKAFVGVNLLVQIKSNQEIVLEPMNNVITMEAMARTTWTGLPLSVGLRPDCSSKSWAAGRATSENWP